MASELTVQTIKGPTSGANANKVIIPSGHTLDASGGTLVPSAGQVVQEVVGSTTSLTSTSSNSWTATALDVTITPKFSDSLIIIKVFSSAFFNTANTSSDYIRGTIFRDSTNLGVSGDASLSLYGAYGNSQTYTRPFVFGTNDSPNTTSSVTYTMYIKKYLTTNTGSVNDYRFNNQIIATEIKQ